MSQEMFQRILVDSESTLKIFLSFFCTFMLNVLIESEFCLFLSFFLFLFLFLSYQNIAKQEFSLFFANTEKINILSKEKEKNKMRSQKTWLYIKFL
jgi:hypothetical protein